MQVNKSPTSDINRADGPAKPSAAVLPTTAIPPRRSAVVGRSRADAVQISEAGRNLAQALENTSLNHDSNGVGAADLGHQATSSTEIEARDGVTWERSSLDPARLEEIQARIASGVYLSSEVTDLVARAILARGEL